MKKKTKIKTKKNWIFWTPRIVSIIFILFLAVFSLDVFDPANNYNFLQTLLAFFMHNLPVFILAICLYISWQEKNGWLAGSIFILAGLLYIFQMIWNAFSNPAGWYLLSYSIIIAGPAFLIGILFLIGWKRSKR